MTHGFSVRSPRKSAAVVSETLARLAWILAPAGTVAVPPMLVGDPLTGCLAFAAVAFAFVCLILHREAVLSRRIAAPDGGRWSIEVNGAAVDTITDADLARIERRAFRSYEANIGQLVEYLGVVSSVVNAAFRAGPIALFWFLALIAVLDPAGLVAMMAAPSAKVVAGFVSLFLKLLGISALLMAHFTPGFRGMRSCFKDEKLDMLRRLKGFGAADRIHLSVIA